MNDKNRCPSACLCPSKEMVFSPWCSAASPRISSARRSPQASTPAKVRENSLAVDTYTTAPPTEEYSSSTRREITRQLAREPKRPWTRTTKWGLMWGLPAAVLAEFFVL